MGSPLRGTFFASSSSSSSFSQSDQRGGGGGGTEEGRQEKGRVEGRKLMTTHYVRVSRDPQKGLSERKKERKKGLFSLSLPHCKKNEPKDTKNNLGGKKILFLHNFLFPFLSFPLENKGRKNMCEGE